MDARTPVTVEFYSDIVCPWCLIGKTRLEQAAAEHGGIELSLRWRSFLLNPKMPREGMDRAAYLNAKFGGGAAGLYERIADAGEEAGIGFRFDAIARTPDSRPAHGLIQSAGEDAGGVIDELFEAYFIKGDDIGDDGVLAATAARHSLPYPAADRHSAQVERDLDEANRIGIQGVPFYVFDGGMALSGAHPPSAYMPIFDAAIAARARLGAE